ncbi:helix-turn-helix domain-containing protein [Kitasatospora sp. NPDC050463]|uniref:AraC family transcriptional regulator n=1 Tax=Kitasatospora sp. NPDC050463 TaxID=3155786 RepID=UPI0033FCC63F
MKIDTLSSHDERLRRAIPHIVAQVRDGEAAVSLEELAMATHTSPDYLRRVFRHQVGEPIHRYVRRLRLSLAAYRLVYGDRTIIDIAVSAGYNSHAAFTRAFRSAYGICPTDLRTNPQNTAWPTAGAAGTDIRPAAIPQRRVAFYSHLGPIDSADTAWERLRGWLTTHGHCPARSKALGVSYDDPDFFIGARTRHDICVPVPDRFDPQSRDGMGVQVVPTSSGLAMRHVGPPELIPFTYMHLAVSAATKGMQRTERPPLPYYLEFSSFPSAHPERQVAVDVYLMPHICRN